MMKKFNVTAYFIGIIFSVIGAAQAAEKIGNCEVMGKKGEFAFPSAIAGQLTVNVSLPAPAWLNGDTPETVKDGFEYCLAANIAHRAGVDKVVLNNVGWDALITGQGKSFDIGLSEISITEERKKVVDFSVPYFSADIGLLVKAGKTFDEKTVKDARIGVQATTTGQAFISDVVKPTKAAKVFPDISSLFTALQANQIDVAVNDTPIVFAKAKESAGKFVVIGQYATGDEYGALMPKGSKNKAIIDKIIQSMQADGTLKSLSETWLAPAWGGDPTAVTYFKP